MARRSWLLTLCACVQSFGHMGADALHDEEAEEEECAEDLVAAEVPHGHDEEQGMDEGEGAEEPEGQLDEAAAAGATPPARAGG